MASSSSFTAISASLTIRLGKREARAAMRSERVILFILPQGHLSMYRRNPTNSSDHCLAGVATASAKVSLAITTLLVGPHSKRGSCDTCGRWPEEHKVKITRSATVLSGSWFFLSRMIAHTQETGQTGSLRALAHRTGRRHYLFSPLKKNQSEPKYADSDD